MALNPFAVPQVGHRASSSEQQYKRAYMACLNCRQTKAKCETSSDPNSCFKCQRERRQCVFTSQRSNKKRKRRSDRRPEMGKSHHLLDMPETVPEGHSTNLEAGVLQGVVTNNSDALGLLLAATENNASRRASPSQDQRPPDSAPSSAHGETAIAIWRRHVLVRKGWLTAAEAASYTELFFQNLAVLTPVASSFSHLRTHPRRLIEQEPLLCCTLLMISSRYHALPTESGRAKSDWLHERLWQNCQRLVQRITFGQDRFHQPASRTYGSIQALLLMTDWHAKALHYPPEYEGWDAMPVETSGTDRNREAASPTGPAVLHEEVRETARRSDRMSWMLIGLACSLAHELGIFVEQDTNGPLPSPEAREQCETRALVALYATQLSLRVGYTNMVPSSLAAIKAQLPNRVQEPYLQDWVRIISLWIEITTLRKTTTDVMLPTKNVTQQLVNSGRYLGLLEHFEPLFARWYTEFLELELEVLPQASKTMLLFDYLHVKMYTNSLAVQATVERRSSRMWATQREYGILSSQDAADRKYIDQVIDASRTALTTASELAKSDMLKFCPVRVFIVITSAAVFLLKATSLGARRPELERSLQVLENCISALSSNVCDTVHLSSRYGALLEHHLQRFRRSLEVHRLVGDQLNATQGAVSAAEGANVADKASGGVNAQWPDDDFTMTPAPAAEEWFTQPFDPSFAPFTMDDEQVGAGFDLSSLDLLWNS